MWYFRLSDHHRLQFVRHTLTQLIVNLWPCYRRSLPLTIVGTTLSLLVLASCAPQIMLTPTSLPTLVPSSTPTVEPTPSPAATASAADATPEVTEAPTITLKITPLAGAGNPPPFDIQLPEGWWIGYDTLALPDIDALRAVPLAVYQGPVSAGTGTIVVLWGFPNLVAGFPQPGATPEPDLWSDGLRLFRLAMVDQGCNSGTDLQRTYRVGSLSATGTQFSIIDCPESPDTRGWFAALREGGLNFVFYMYAEPIGAMETADEELQAILDSVVFHVTAD